MANIDAGLLLDLLCCTWYMGTLRDRIRCKQRHEIKVSRKAHLNIRKRRIVDFVRKISQHSHNMASKLKQRVGLFNCDGTYKLDAVERFLLDIQEKHGFKFSTDKHYKSKSFAKPFFHS